MVGKVLSEVGHGKFKNSTKLSRFSLDIDGEENPSDSLVVLIWNDVRNE